MVHARPRSRRAVEAVAFRPPRALGVLTGGAFTVWAVVVAAVAASVALASAVETKTFVAWIVAGTLALAALTFAHWTYALVTLDYIIDKNTLTIRWGFRRVIVPIDAIQRMVPGRTLDEPRVRGQNWWGCHIGSADVKRIGFTLFYSTHRAPEELLYVVTTGESYAITVLDQAAFAEEIQARARVATAEEPHPQRSSATGLAALPFWRDRVATTTAALSVLAGAVLFGYVYSQYPGLPDVIQLNFPALGGIVRVGDKSELLRIVYLGLGVLAVNTTLGIFLHARERAAGLWMLASGGMLQCVLLAAAILALERS
ncbi:MAG: hypothetical protein HUU14_00695 [Dehalococcoidia bacterium]|nr:PH domain-containing protein [Dehalococcoidia bacterium]NUQ54387.1 hypothetical protein [Dehalococcoidia bacterium]